MREMNLYFGGMEDSCNYIEKHHDSLWNYRRGIDAIVSREEDNLKLKSESNGE